MTTLRSRAFPRPPTGCRKASLPLTTLDILAQVDQSPHEGPGLSTRLPWSEILRQAARLMMLPGCGKDRGEGDSMTFPAIFKPSVHSRFIMKSP